MSRDFWLGLAVLPVLAVAVAVAVVALLGAWALLGAATERLGGRLHRTRRGDLQQARIAAIVLDGGRVYLRRILPSVRVVLVLGGEPAPFRRVGSLQHRLASALSEVDDDEGGGWHEDGTPLRAWEHRLLSDGDADTPGPLR